MKSRYELAYETKNWPDLADFISGLGQKDIPKIRRFIPNLLKHSSWVVRSECLDLIGNFRLKEFLPLVAKKLKDTNVNVRAYALSAYYDIEKDKSLLLIKRYMRNQDIRLRIMALALLYIETRSLDVLCTIEKIVTRKNCDYHHQFTFIHQFEHYLDIKKRPEILDLYKKILGVSSPNSGVAKHIKRTLKKMNTTG